MPDMLSVAFGGGRNSAMLLGMYEHGIVPDIITFANTGRADRAEGEKPKTYENVDRMSRWCESHFGIPITEVFKRSQYKSLYDQSMRTASLPSAAYGLRSCSDKWKIQPQDRFMNNYGPAITHWNTCLMCSRLKDAHLIVYVKDGLGKKVKGTNGRFLFSRPCFNQSIEVFTGSKITKAIGYDAGELRRATIQENDKYRYRYFLIEWGWYLEDCIAAYKRHGLPVPVKSACYYCPSSTKEEVIKLHDENPELFESAVAMEDNAIANGNLTTVKGLGRHWSWRELLAKTQQERDVLIQAPPMSCVCFDSED